jgi:hypothetical protein
MNAKGFAGIGIRQVRVTAISDQLDWKEQKNNAIPLCHTTLRIK